MTWNEGIDCVNKTRETTSNREKCFLHSGTLSCLVSVVSCKQMCRRVQKCLLRQYYVNQSLARYYLLNKIFVFNFFLFSILFCSRNQMLLLREWHKTTSIYFFICKSTERTERTNKIQAWTLIYNLMLLNGRIWHCVCLPNC